MRCRFCCLSLSRLQPVTAGDPRVCVRRFRRGCGVLRSNAALPRSLIAMALVLARTLLNVAVYGLLLFLPAWTLDWWRAWLLLALLFAGMLVMRFWAFGHAAGLLEERRKPPIQAGQPLADKLLVVAFVTVFPGFIAFIPIDVFRLHLFSPPAPALSAIGLGLAVAGWWIIALAFRENAFAAAIVKHQSERRQTAIDTGVYGVVRHPLYAGVVLALIGVALWLQSYAATLLAIVPIAVLLVRILVEEAFLTERLDGYAAYRKRTKKRLIPGIW